MLEVIESRRSIRKYANKEVEEEKIFKLLDSARLAPSGSNTQPWNYIIVKSDELRRELSVVTHNQSWMMTAPVFIVCVADICCRIEDSDELYLDEQSSESELKQIIRDTAISIEHIVLEAQNIGLSTCWTAWFEQSEIRPILNIPNDKYVCCVLTVGYSDEEPKQRPRRKLEDIIRYEKWI